MDNYTVLHLHSDCGNGGFVDSTCNYKSYVDKAVEFKMKSIAFTEHGNVFSWFDKKMYCEKHGLKYIHGIEMYVTETFDEKIRDNYHVCMYAKNFEGFKEINKLSSLSYKRNLLNRYYYNPRISIDELIGTSNNIIITSACLGGILSKGNHEIKNKFLDFMKNNRDRSFLEVQPFKVQKQIQYNKELYNISLETGLRIIVGTDTHCLDEVESRNILQRSKKIHFEEEENWDLTFKSYDTLVESFVNQDSLEEKVFLEAINNTNVLSDMVEEFTLDFSNKYPHIHDDPDKIIEKRIKEGIEIRGADFSQHKERIEYELETFKKNDALQFLLLEDKVKSFCRKNNIRYGYSRGSISGSYIAYLLQITDIDSVKWGMSFERFMSPDRISLADIDTDYEPSKRSLVKDFLFYESGLNCCDIITYNTIALKGAIRDVGRALGFDLKIVNDICENVETSEGKYRRVYKELFKFVDKLNGTIVSVGNHACGVMVTDLNLEELVATFTTSVSDYPISQINMKEIDAQNYVKLDLLGLDNIELIRTTCQLANINWIETDKIDFNDQNVWDSISESSTMIFQWESGFAHTIYKKLFSKNTINKIKKISPNITNIDLLSVGNGSIRPAGQSYRDRLSDGEFNDNKHEALNNLLSDTLGFLVYQEQVLDFLHQFCGYTRGEADIVRRSFAKKTGTEIHIPIIKKRFIETMTLKYGENKEKYEEIIIYFLQVIEDASSYLFSKNHSIPYSIIGYVCAWLRYYYPLEFLTSAFNIYTSKKEKSIEIFKYANLKKISIKSPKFRFSKNDFFFDKRNNCIYKGIGSIKGVPKNLGEELYQLRDLQFEDFVDLLIYIEENQSLSKKIRDLIVLNFFDEFGKNQKLLTVFDEFKSGKLKYNKKLSEKTKVNRVKGLKVLQSELENLSIPFKEQIEFEFEILGYLQCTYNINVRYAYVLDVLDKSNIYAEYSPRVSLYCFKNGKTAMVRISQTHWKEFGVLKNGDVIYGELFSEKNAIGYENERYVKRAGKIWWLKKYNVVSEKIIVDMI